MRLGYGEHETFEVLESGEQYESQWANYIMVMGNSVLNGVLQSGQLISGLYVYRVDSIERVGMKGFRTDQQYQSNRSCVVRYTCTLDVLATLYLHENNGGIHTPGFTLNARWSRLPMKAVTEPFQIRPAQMKRLYRTSFPDDVLTDKREWDGVVHDFTMVWVEATFAHDGFHTVGTWACIDREDRDYVDTTSGGVVYKNFFPSLDLVMQDPTCLYSAASVSELVNLAVTVRCPYLYMTVTSGSEVHHLLCNSSLNEIVRSYGKTYEGAGTRERVIAYQRRYMIERSARTFYVNLDDDATKPVATCGQIILYDVNGAQVGNVDVRYAGVYNSHTAVKFIQRTYFNGLNHVTELELDDGTVIRFPEGNLMFVGDAWNEYARTQLSYDRELTAMSQEKIMADMWSGITGSLVNGSIAAIGAGKGLGAASAAAGIATTAITAQMESVRLEEKQWAKEHLMQNTPDTIYNSTVGMTYIYNIKRSCFGYVQVMCPDGVSVTEVGNYVKYAGYPVTDLYMGVTMAQLQGTVQGFLQANALLEVIEGNTVKVCAGFLRTVLDRQLRQGIHFKVIT